MKIDGVSCEEQKQNFDRVNKNYHDHYTELPLLCEVTRISFKFSYQEAKQPSLQNSGQ